MDGNFGCLPVAQIPRPGFRRLAVILGAFLLLAAALKAHGLVLDPVSQDSFLASPRLQIATIEIEVLLGLLLLSGWSARAAWGAVLAFFGLLSGVSLYLALEGQRSCGCFGRFSISPWITFGLDLAVVAALLHWRPCLSPLAPVGRGVGGEGNGQTVRHAPRSPGLRDLLKLAGGAVAFLVLIGGTFLLACDDPADTLARLRGEAITVEPGISDVGEGAAGEQRTFSLQLTNHTNRPVRVVGGTSSCDCTAIADLPIVVPPGESRTITVQVKLSGSLGRFQHRFVLYTDDEKQRVVASRFAGRVTNPP